MEAKERARAWALANPERVKETKRKSHWKLRREVLSAYCEADIVCAQCGFTDVRALQLDHIDGGGAKQVRELKGRGWTLYRWLRKNNFPQGYQVLCANCNWIKRHTNEEWGK